MFAVSWCLPNLPGPWTLDKTSLKHNRDGVRLPRRGVHHQDRAAFGQIGARLLTAAIEDKLTGATPSCCVRRGIVSFPRAACRRSP